MLSDIISFLFSIAVIVFFLILLFAVRRIRIEAIAINKRLRTVNMILREVHEDKIHPKECQNCKISVPFGQNNCSKCGTKLEW